MKTVEFMDLEFEEDDGRKVLNFLQMIGKAKHEPRYVKHINPLLMQTSPTFLSYSRQPGTEFN